MKNNSPHKGRNKVRKHGIPALQFLKIECCDTQLARGFHPLDPEHEKGKINRAKQLEKKIQVQIHTQQARCIVYTRTVQTIHDAC